MSRSVKKSNSRQMFEAVFEQQTRRFSAFDLLGLSSEAPSSPPYSRAPEPALSNLADAPSSIEEARAEKVVAANLGQQLGETCQAKDLRPDSHVHEQGPDGRTQEQRPDSGAFVLRPDSGLQKQSSKGSPQESKRRIHGRQKGRFQGEQARELGPDRGAQDQTLDGQGDQTLDGQALGLTVWPSLGQTSPMKSLAELGSDRQALGQTWSPEAILLAPLQWAVWLALQKAEASRGITTYRQIARETNSTIDGVRKAVRVIQKEGGIQTKETVRSAEEQGFRVTLNRDIVFRRGTLNEAKAILKRGLSLGHTTNRMGQTLRPDGLRMYVCLNTNIKQTDIAQLLRIAPPEWKIREQTLIQVADALPDMTAIEFRLSLIYLIEQAKSAKEPIRHPNAWVKAAFEKNRGPLVTEREIEARFEQHPNRHGGPRLRSEEEENDEELEILRRYLTCDPQVRAEIDRMAEEKAALSLKVVSADKRAGVIEEARLEAVREFFCKKLEPLGP